MGLCTPRLLSYHRVLIGPCNNVDLPIPAPDRTDAARDHAISVPFYPPSSSFSVLAFCLPLVSSLNVNVDTAPNDGACCRGVHSRP